MLEKLCISQLKSNVDLRLQMSDVSTFTPGYKTYSEINPILTLILSLTIYSCLCCQMNHVLSPNQTDQEVFIRSFPHDHLRLEMTLALRRQLLHRHSSHLRRNIAVAYSNTDALIVASVFVLYIIKSIILHSDVSYEKMRRMEALTPHYRYVLFV